VKTLVKRLNVVELTMKKPSRTPITEAYHWISVVITITLEMVLPAWAGNYLDKRWSTGSVFAILGACLGMVIAISHLIQLTQNPPGSSGKSKPRK